MIFTVEQIVLVDEDGASKWGTSQPIVTVAEIDAADGESVLSMIVRREGGVEVGLRASYQDGQAIMIAQREKMVYALRARPL